MPENIVPEKNIAKASSKPDYSLIPAGSDKISPIAQRS